MFTNTLSPTLGATANSLDEHMDSYPLNISHLRTNKELRGLGVIQNGYFLGIIANSKQPNELIYSADEVKTTVFLRKKGVVYVQVNQAVKQGEIAALNSTGIFSKTDDSNNPIGFYTQDSFEQGEIKIGVLQFNAMSPMLVTKNNAAIGKKSTDHLIDNDKTIKKVEPGIALSLTY
ncbi:hypothetical protein ABSA28_00539 [Candidatus Hepatincolaceae symbiont of Richtersius coronifer]